MGGKEVRNNRSKIYFRRTEFIHYFDGSYLEGIEAQANGLTRLEYLTKGIAAVQQAAREGEDYMHVDGIG